MTVRDTHIEKSGSGCLDAHLFRVHVYTLRRVFRRHEDASRGAGTGARISDLAKGSLTKSMPRNGLWMVGRQGTV
jgi:hypothetical protein